MRLQRSDSNSITKERVQATVMRINHARCDVSTNQERPAKPRGLHQPIEDGQSVNIARTAQIDIQSHGRAVQAQALLNQTGRCRQGMVWGLGHHHDRFDRSSRPPQSVQ